MKRTTVIIFLLLLSIMLVACSIEDGANQNKQNTIYAEKKSTKFANKDKDEVLSYLSDLGFTNIVLVPAEKGDSTASDNEVITISIDGNDSFGAWDAFAPTSEVIITYCDARIFEGIEYDAAYSKTVVTKRHHDEFYYVFDNDTHTVWYITYADRKKIRVKKGLFSGELGGNIKIDYDDNSEEFLSSRYRLVRTNDQWEYPTLNHDQWDPAYDPCDIGDAVRLLYKSK